MNRALWIVCLLVIHGLVTVVSADKISVIDEKKPLVIPFSESRKIQFCNVPQAGQTVLLRIKSRMDHKGIGSLYFLRLILNGREIQPFKGRSVCRLINKPLVSPVTPTMTNKWYDTAGWMVLYAPDFKLGYTKKYYVGDPYVYVFDVTDLVNPLAENRLEIQNTARLDFIQRVKFPGEKLDLVIGSLEILTKSEASPTMAATESSVNVINRGEPAAGPAKYRGEILPGGSFALHCGKSTYRFTSRFSAPGGKIHRLVDTNDGNGWKVSVKENRVVGECSDYTLARTVKFTPRRIEVCDMLTNKKQQPLGLSVHHELDLSSLNNPPIRLAGNPDPSVSELWMFANPSVHIVTPEGGLGFIAEDDVFRGQAKIYVQTGKNLKTTAAGLATENLRLAPGETYTLQWSIYPVTGPDYYDFINLVREDWGANYTVLGPWRWGFHAIKDMSVDQIRDVIKRQGIKYFIAEDWVEWEPNEKGTQRIAFGTDVMSDYWASRRKYYAEVIQRIRQAAPEVKVLAYYNARRESADDTLARFADSLLKDETG
ncbi:MAG: hypothetical protein GX629_03630, partial [Phycisphaerae bacterium]|nr:hypothetical protein [Phycisphaerae bacterium]